MSKKKRFSKADMTTYNYYKRQVTKLGGKVMTQKQWERYRDEEITKFKNLGREYTLTSVNQRMIGISADLIEDTTYMGQMRARARQLYLEGGLNVDPDKLSDAQLMKNEQIQKDRIALKENYENLKAAYENAVANDNKTFIYKDEVYLVANGLNKAFSQAFFGSI